MRTQNRIESNLFFSLSRRPSPLDWMDRAYLEVDGEEEVRGGVLPEARAAERGGDGVVVAGEHVVEARVGAEPVDAGGAEQPVGGRRRLAAPPSPAGEVAARAQVEEVPGRRGPAVGAPVQVHLPQRAGGHGLFPPAGVAGGGGVVPAVGRGRAHRRSPARGKLVDLGAFGGGAASPPLAIKQLGIGIRGVLPWKKKGCLCFEALLSLNSSLCSSNSRCYGRCYLCVHHMNNC
jgi:hypothetical protein